MVRQQFKKHMNETDPEKIQKLKDEWVFSLFLLQASSECRNLWYICFIHYEALMGYIWFKMYYVLVFGSAARGLINHMLFESEKLTGRKVSQRSWSSLVADSRRYALSLWFHFSLVMAASLAFNKRVCHRVTTSFNDYKLWWSSGSMVGILQFFHSGFGYHYNSILTK